MSHFPQRTLALVISGPFLGVSAAADASIQVFLDHERQWQAAAGPTDTIDFVLDSAQILDDQYSHLGVLFLGGNDGAVSMGAFELDGWGAFNNGFSPPSIQLVFDIPRHAFAAYYPGTRGIMAFANGELIFEGAWGGEPGGSFMGIVSDIPIDEVWLVGFGTVAIDNIYFSQAPIPAPGAIVLLALGALTGRGRRRVERSS